jgi:hypothetical protein
MFVGSRFVAVAALALGVVAAQGQAWEKLVMPGLSYRMEVDLATPRVVHALRYSPGSPFVRPRPEVANLVVYTPNETKGREELSALVKRVGAVAGVNGDFHPYTGDPLGAMVRNGELISPPFPDRAVFAWGPKIAAVGRLKWKATLYPEGAEKIEIDAMNEEWGTDGYVLNTASSGLSMAKLPNAHLVIKLDEGPVPPTGKVTGVFESVITDQEAIQVDEGRAVLVARGEARIARLSKLKPGQKVTIDVATMGLDWKKVDNVIGGGPFLVVNGAKFVDWKEAGFKENFAQQRHPRTAIGRTKAGDIWLVAVDGRQPMSDGATLNEMADIMLNLGCIDAINLDGGGSTGLNLYGVNMNRPSDGKERPLSNAVLFVGKVAAPSDSPVVIRGPARIDTGGRGLYTIVGEDGKTIPTSEVFWGATGAAWIDQGGMLRALGQGQATVEAWVRGQVVSVTVQVGPPPPTAGG